MVVDAQASSDRWPLATLTIHVDDVQLVTTADTPADAAGVVARSWADVVHVVRGWRMELAPPHPGVGRKGPQDTARRG